MRGQNHVEILRTDNFKTQNQTTASSYALPPQSYLAAPPCSIYCKRSKPLQPQRQTYLAVRDGSNGQKTRLVSITEDLGKPQSEEREPRAPSRRERKLRQGKITAADVVGTGNDTDVDERSVLVSYTNGNIDCMSGDLTATRWEHTKEHDSELEFEVEFAAVVDFDTARKGLLRNREDVLALVDTASGSALPLLVQVTRLGSQRSMTIYAVRNAHGQALQSHRSSVEELLSYELPFRHRDGSAKYELHTASGMLYQRISNRLNVVDLSGTAPKLIFELGRKGKPVVKSFTRLSSATVLVVSPTSIGVYDIKYGSLLSSLDYSTVQASQNAMATNQLGHEQAVLSIITQFSDLSIIVGLSGTNLVAWQVGDMLDDGRRAKAHGPLLLEVMDKGKVAQGAFGISRKEEKRRKRWEEWTSKVDRFVSDADVDGLEDLIANDFVANNVLETQETPTGDANGHANGHSPSERGEWDLSADTFDARNINRAKAMYLLRMVFRWRSVDAQTDQGKHRLEVAVFSRNILRWLALAGYLTAQEIQLALSDSTQETAEAQPQVVPGDVMAAIGEGESSLRLMCEMVKLPVHWPVDDVVRGVQFFTRLLDPSSAEIEPLKALTNGDVSMEDGDVESELAAAVKQLDEAQYIMESGLEVRSELSRLLLLRLQSFPHKDVVRSMQRTMTTEDIMFFILLLRMELGKGGWTSKYIGLSDDEQDLAEGLDSVQDIEPSNQAIRTIANLCSCAIDAVGLSGWVVGRSANMAETIEFLDRLRNEVSAALEGLFQAERLEMVLTEAKKAAGAAQVKASLKRKRENEEEEPLSVEQTLLPLGGRGEPPVVKDWYTKSGIKSKAAIAQEKNRNVGKYSFERIRI